MDMVKTIESITELLIGKKSAPTKKTAKAKPKRKTAKKKGKWNEHTNWCHSNDNSFSSGFYLLQNEEEGLNETPLVHTAYIF